MGVSPMIQHESIEGLNEGVKVQGRPRGFVVRAWTGVKGKKPAVEEPMTNSQQIDE